jgi:hypothetical protein
MFNLLDFKITELTDDQNELFAEYITSASVSWSMDGVSEVMLEIFDPRAIMFRNNYFQVRRELSIGDGDKNLFEIASVEVNQGEGDGAGIRLECRRKPIQQMKRDRNTDSIKGITATDYAALAAQKYGLDFVGQSTSVPRKVQKATGADADERVWGVITRLAGEAQFSAFESDGTLYFASQEWLLGKWANLDFKYPSENDSPFQVLQLPNCRRSDDADSLDSEASFVLQRSSTTEGLRAGMTINLINMGEFDRQYLIAEVSYALGQPDPIGVACKSPYRKQPKR